MSKIKRALSAFLAIAIVFGMFSCLAPIVAPVSSAAEPGVSKIKKYADLVKDYGTNVTDGYVDGFVYFGYEFYEKDADGNYALTDYYVKPGDQLMVKVYVKSNMMCGDFVLCSMFDKNYWDVKLLYDNVPEDQIDEDTGYNYGVEPFTNVNTAHTCYEDRQFSVMMTSMPSDGANTTWLGKNCCGFSDEYRANHDFVMISSLVNKSPAPAYEFTDDAYMFEYKVKVKTGLADGTTFSTESPRELWQIPTYTRYLNRKGNIFCSHPSQTDVNFGSTLNINKMPDSITKGYLDYLLLDDLSHTFTIGNPPAGNEHKATFKVDGTEYSSANYASGASVPAPAENPSKEGYTFLGWAIEGTDTVLTFPQTMGNADVTYVAVFEEIVKYTATFMVDGSVYDTVKEYAEGETIVAPSDPHKDGYKFSGWNPTVGTMGTSNITFNAQWTANTYNVKFYKEKTDASAYQTLSVKFDGAYNLPAAPSKTGYTFVKWVDANGNDMPSTHTVVGDVSFYASWSAGTFNATFDADGGTFANGQSTMTVPTVFGEAIVAPADPTKTGYTFDGWSPEVGNMTAEGMKFTAKWKAAKIGVHFMDGDTELTVLTGEYDQPIAAMSPNPSKDGYTFKGWKYADGKTADFPIKLGAEAVYVYAVWEAKSYYIDFYDGVGGNWITGGNQNCGDTIVAPDAPSKNGSTFIGWVDADGNPMPEKVPAIENQIYYAKYEATKYTATFYMDSTKSEVHDTYQGTYQSVIPAPEVPTKVGYTFKHWSKEGSTSKVTFNATNPKMPLNGVNYVAQWNINSHDVIYYVDNVEVHRDTYDYDADITAWTYTPDEGVSFTGWGDQVPAKMPDNDVKVYGTTGTASYNVTFTIDGVVFSTVPVAYGQPIQVPTAPDKTGYTFSGWKVPATMPAGDQTYDATYTVNKYWVRFYLDDAKTNLYKEMQLDYDSTISYPVEPTLDGQEFIEWDQTPEKVPAENIDIIATFNPIEYAIEFLDEDGVVVDGYEWTAYWNETVNASDAPELTKDGYDFDGWYVNGVKQTFPVTVQSDLTFEAKFTIKSLKVIYYVDGEQYAYDPYEFGASITLRDVLTKEGYTFSGWKDEEGNAASLPATMPAEDIKVYGTWTPIKYTVTFDAGDGLFSNGSKTKSFEVDYGTMPTPPTDVPVKEGYGFKAWTPDLTLVGVGGATYVATYSAGTVNYKIETYIMDTTGVYGAPQVATKSDDTDATVSVTPEEKTGFTLDRNASVLSGTVKADGNTVLKVYYIRNQYKLTINVDGSEPNETMYYYDETIPTVQDPVKTGYQFNGWSKDIPAKMPAEDVSVTALFTIKQFTITFVDTGDSAYAAITKDYNALVGEVSDPVKTGYSFTGWVDENGDAIEIPERIPATNLTIKATWRINQYTIKFVNTGDTAIEDIVLDYGAAIAAVSDPSKTGHNFTGWVDEQGKPATIPTTMPAENRTYSATWEAIIYNAVFKIDGEDTIVPTAFGEIPVAPTPTKVGHTFKGWVEGDVVAMVVGGATYTAKFDPNTYDAIFQANGGSWNGSSADKVVPTVFGEAINAPEAPTREAYIFTGWSPEVGNMTTEGITFVAQWTNDTTICRVQSVTLKAPTVLTNITKAAYEIKVIESPVKIQICGGDDYTFTWTYDRLDEKVPGDLSEAGLVSIVAYNENNEVISDSVEDKRVAYEKWTVVTMLSEGSYKVRAKIGYTSEDWENIETARDYTVEFTNIADVSEAIKSVTPAENVVKRGNSSTITVVADSAVTRLRLVMTKEDGTSMTVSYSPTATSYTTVSSNGDGTSTWVLTMRFTYSGSDLEQDQKWVVWYRTDGGSSWLETDKSADVKVTKYLKTDSPSTSYAEFSIVSVTPPTDAVRAQYAEVVVVTTSDVTKVRLGYNGKTSTYLQTSNNVTYSDNGNGTATWTIRYRFANVGEQTWEAQCRGNKWSEKTEFTFTVAEA